MVNIPEGANIIPQPEETDFSKGVEKKFIADNPDHSMGFHEIPEGETLELSPMQERVFEKFKSEQDAELAGIIDRARQLQPNQALRALELGRRYGFHPSHVSDNMEAFEERDARRLLQEYQGIIRDNPILLEYAQSPEGARILQVDYDPLDRTSRIVGRIMDLSGTESSGVFDWAKDVGSAAWHGTERLYQSYLGLRVAFGGMDPEDAAEEFVNSVLYYNEIQKKYPSYRKEWDALAQVHLGNMDKTWDSFVSGLGDIVDGKVLDGLMEAGEGGILTIGHVLSMALDNVILSPRGISHVIAENLALSVPSLAMGKAGAVAGGTTGTPHGAFAGFLAGVFTGATTVGSGLWVLQALERRNIDTTSVEDVAQAFRNPELMDEIRKEAASYGFTYATVETLGASFAGRAVVKLEQQAAQTALKEASKGVIKTKGPTFRAAAWARTKEMAGQAFFESLGEFGGQYAALRDLKEVDFGEAILEGLTSFGHSIPEISMGLSIRRNLNKDTIAAIYEYADMIQEANQATVHAKHMDDLITTIRETESLKDAPAEVEAFILAMERGHQMDQQRIRKEVLEEARSEDGIAGDVETEIAARMEEASKVYFRVGEWDAVWGSVDKSGREEFLRMWPENEAQVYDSVKPQDGMLFIDRAKFISMVLEDENANLLVQIARETPDGLSFVESQELYLTVDDTMSDIRNEARAIKKMKLSEGDRAIARALMPEDEYEAMIEEHYQKAQEESPDEEVDRADSEEAVAREVLKAKDPDRLEGLGIKPDEAVRLMEARVRRPLEFEDKMWDMVREVVMLREGTALAIRSPEQTKKEFSRLLTGHRDRKLSEGDVVVVASVIGDPETEWVIGNFVDEGSATEWIRNLGLVPGLEFNIETVESRDQKEIVSSKGVKPFDWLHPALKELKPEVVNLGKDTQASNIELRMVSVQAAIRVALNFRNFEEFAPESNADYDSPMMVFEALFHSEEISRQLDESRFKKHEFGKYGDIHVSIRDSIGNVGANIGPFYTYDEARDFVIVYFGVDPETGSLTRKTSIDEGYAENMLLHHTGEAEDQVFQEIEQYLREVSGIEAHGVEEVLGALAGRPKSSFSLGEQINAFRLPTDALAKGKWAVVVSFHKDEARSITIGPFKNKEAAEAFGDKLDKTHGKGGTYEVSFIRTTQNRALTKADINNIDTREYLAVKPDDFMQALEGRMTDDEIQLTQERDMAIADAVVDKMLGLPEFKKEGSAGNRYIVAAELPGTDTNVFVGPFDHESDAKNFKKLMNMSKTGVYVFRPKHQYKLDANDIDKFLEKQREEAAKSAVSLLEVATRTELSEDLFSTVSKGEKYMLLALTTGAEIPIVEIKGRGAKAKKEALTGLLEGSKIKTRTAKGDVKVLSVEFVTQKLTTGAEEAMQSSILRVAKREAGERAFLGLSDEEQAQLAIEVGVRKMYAHSPAVAAIDPDEFHELITFTGDPAELAPAEPVEAQPTEADSVNVILRQQEAPARSSKGYTVSIVFPDGSEFLAGPFASNKSGLSKAKKFKKDLDKAKAGVEVHDPKAYERSGRESTPLVVRPERFIDVITAADINELVETLAEERLQSRKVQVMEEEMAGEYLDPYTGEVRIGHWFLQYFPDGDTVNIGPFISEDEAERFIKSMPGHVKKGAVHYIEFEEGAASAKWPQDRYNAEYFVPFPPAPSMAFSTAEVKNPSNYLDVYTPDSFGERLEQTQALIQSDPINFQADLFDQAVATPEEEAEQTAAFDVSDRSLEMEPSRVFLPPEETIKAANEVMEINTLEEAQAILEEWKEYAKNIGEEQDNSDKFILSLFDHSGVWSQPWEDAGYNVIRWDIKDGVDILSRIGDILQDIETDVANGINFVGVLSACPCTTFAASGARWWAERHDVDSEEMTEKMWGRQAVKDGFVNPLQYNQFLVAATEEIIAAANPDFFALENPIGRIGRMTGLPAPTLIFEPHHYGDPYTKKTQLWGKFNPDLPQANVDPIEGSRMHKLRGDDPAQKAARSITPEGFAYAFFMAQQEETAIESADRVEEARGVFGDERFDKQVDRFIAGRKEQFDEDVELEVAQRQVANDLLEMLDEGFITAPEQAVEEAPETAPEAPAEEGVETPTEPTEEPQAEPEQAEEAPEEEAEPVDAGGIIQEMRRRLFGARRLRADYARSAAQIARGVRVLAQRSGMSIEDFLQRYPLPQVLRQRFQRIEGLQVEEHEQKEIPKEEQQQQALAKGIVAFFEQDGAINSVISMLGSSDVSTFVHEMGHFYFRILEDLAVKEEGQFEIDYETALQFLGAEAGTRWEDLTEEQHEKWAKAFEAYIYTGKAPSKALAWAFHHLSQLMKAVYGAFKALGVKLSPEITAVMDRLLATDEEIEAALQDPNSYELIQEGTQVGMTEKMAKAHSDARAEAIRVANAVLTPGMIAVLMRENGRVLREKKRGLIDAIQNEIDNHPGFKALDDMKENKVQKNKLLEGLDQVPKAWQVGKRARKFKYNQIQSLGQVAERYLGEGASETDLIAKIKDLPTKAQYLEKEVRKGMEKAFNMKNVDRKKRRAMAVMALNNRASRKKRRIEYDHFLSEDYREFAKLAKKIIAPPLKSDAEMDALAVEVIMSMPVSSIRIPALTREVQKAARLAAHALFDKDIQKALMFKRQEAQAAANLQAAADFLKYHDKVIKLAKKSKKKKFQENLGRAASASGAETSIYWNAFKGVVDGWLLGKRKNNKKDAERLPFRLSQIKALSLHIENVEGRISAIPERVAELEIETGSYKNLSGGDFKEVGNALMAIAASADKYSEMYALGQESKLEDNIAEIGLQLDRGITTGWFSKAAKTVFSSKMMSPAHTIDTLMEMATGVRDITNLAYKHLIRPIHEAVSKVMMPRLDKMGEDVNEMFEEHYSGEELDQMAEQNIRIDELGFSVSKEELLGLAQLRGTEDGVKALTEATGILANRLNGNLTEEAIDTMLSYLDANDWAFVSKRWQFFEDMAHEAKVTHLRRTGLDLDLVPAKPFAIRGKDGTVHELGGGYWPLKYERPGTIDPTGFLDPSISPSTGIIEFKKGLWGILSQTRHSYRMARKGSKGKVPRLDINVFTQSLRERIIDLSIGDEILYVSRLLKHEDVVKKFRETENGTLYDMLNLWIDDVAIQQRGASHPIERLIRRIRAAGTISKLAFNQATAAVQFTGIFPAMQRVGAGNLMAGFWQFMRNPIESTRQIHEASNLMERRSRILHPDLDETIQRINNFKLSGKVVSKLEKMGVPRSWFKALKALYFFQTIWAQHFIDKITFLGSMRKNAPKIMSGEMTYEDTIFAAERDVEEVFASPLWSSRTGLGRGTYDENNRQNEFFRMFAFLASYAMQKPGQFALATSKRARNIEADPKRSPIEIFLWAKDATMIFMFEAMLAAIIKGQLPDEDEEETWADFALRQMGMEMINSVPIASDIGNAISEDGFGGRVAGSWGSFIQGLRSFRNPVPEEGEPFVAYVRRIWTPASYMMNLPGIQVNRILDAYMRYQDGDDVPVRDILFGEPRR
jgi:hypothetical protein